MLKLESIRIQPGDGADILRRKCAKLLRIQEKDIVSLRLLKQSIDARESVDLVCSVLVALKHENAVLRRIHDRRITLYTPPPAYMPPEKLPAPKTPPVVVGAGPAGLFCTLILAEAGLHPILLERGKPVEQRQQDVLHFWESGVLNLSSNVQFGEGGAGAFSDGKLNTGTKNPRHRYILEEFTACGAPETILTDAMPHMGTDYLHIVLTALRSKLIALGADVRFESRLADLHLEDGTLVSAVIDGLDGTYFLPCQQLVLAPGHSARDTFEMLHARGVPMEAKPFAVGVRIEHRQSDMDAAQYRQYAGHPGLPASSYRLACHLPNGRSAYSFCVCPGGEVVAAASETNRVVTNGMSEFARDRENINGALLINVTPSDFGGEPLDGISFQRQLESAAYALGGGDYTAPVQLVGDFLAGRPSSGPGRVLPSYRPFVRYCNLRQCLPELISTSIEAALPILGQKLHGYDDPDAVLTAVESRSSSPVRILRDETYQSVIRGLYPCGEGAGYAGGILSAAADGMRAAEEICRYILETKAVV